MAPTVIRYSLIHICFITGKLYNIYYIQQMTQLFEIKVNLSENQKKNLSAAYHKRETIVLRLTKNSLRGNDTLYVPAMVKKRKIGD